jgi:oligopeptide/dipeptide ABC transporter ATP-binding protein
MSAGFRRTRGRAKGAFVSLLELRDIEVEYLRAGHGGVRAVAGASLSVDAGQVVGLVGETGCGKSTVARAAVGLLTPTAGSIWFEGRELQPLSRRARSRRDARLQMVFQNPLSSLNPRRRVGDQIADAMTILGLVPAEQRRSRIADLLEQVGLSSDAANRFPHEYSGGQLQRISIARALAAEPSMIVLDEPLSSLDASAQAQVANLLRRLARELHVGLLLISHDLMIVRHIADVVSVMYLGLVVESAPTRQLWTLPLHPYTEGLIAAIPRADGTNGLPRELPGEAPDPAHPPAGCRFNPRCPYAVDRCRIEQPPLLEIADGRRVACWLQDAPGSERRPSEIRFGRGSAVQDAGS